MVYAERGREALYRFARSLESLQAGRELPLEERVEQGRRLMGELQSRGAVEGFAPPSLRGPFEGSADLSPAEFADRYLHPHDVPYTLSRLREHIESSGLQLLRWFENRNWDLEELLPAVSANGELPQDEWERFAIVEELFDRDQYDLILVGPDFQPNDDAFTYDCPLRINPQVHLTQTTFRGFPSTTEARLLFYPPESLSFAQGRLLKAVSDRTATLGELLEEWGEERSDDWFRTGLYLLFRDLVYRPRETE